MSRAEEILDLFEKYGLRAARNVERDIEREHHRIAKPLAYKAGKEAYTLSRAAGHKRSVARMHAQRQAQHTYRIKIYKQQHPFDDVSAYEKGLTSFNPTTWKRTEEK